MVSAANIGLTVVFFLIALLYAAAGGGGGTGYLAAMALFQTEPEMMRSVALLLNILVTSISTWKFVQAGYFSARIYWPVALVSVPAAFWGGRIDVAAELYRPFVGIVLVYAAWRMLQTANRPPPAHPNQLGRRELFLYLAIGIVLGFVSGLLGIGGGIFLGPLLILTGWATVQETIGISAAFVLINSVAGLAGRMSVMAALPSSLWLWIPAVALGGYLGATFAARWLDPVWIRRLLAVVLIVGGIRMVWV